MPSNVLPLPLKQTFPPIIWIFTEGDEIESRLPFKIFFTLLSNLYTVLKTEDDYYLKVVNNVCLTLLLKIHLGRHDADKKILG